jgi:ribulose-phosphate 3-epimerase
MAIICPTVTAYDMHEYREQVERILPFAKRLHIDLMDGEFAPTKSPDFDRMWLPVGVQNDIHLMYAHPGEYLERLIKLRPHLVVIHNEVTVHHMHFAAELHRAGIKTGLALLQDTPVAYAEQIMHSFDQVLIFSGNLGHHGGHADLSLLEKVAQVRAHHPDVEIAWDGGINLDNAPQLIEAGVNVLNVGGFIQHAEDPAKMFRELEQITRS